MPEFKTVTLRPMTGAFDTLSSADEIGFGNWRLVKNATTRSTRNRQRAGGWRRLFADDEPYNNQDLHDQLVDRLGFYDSYVGHASGGGGLSGYGYPYFAPSYEVPGFSIFPSASGPYCPVYIGDFPEGTFEGCPIFYPYVGYPYELIYSPNECNTGYPFYYLYSYVYTSCPVAFPPVDVSGYPYGYPFNVYDPSFSYDYVYCYGDLHLRQGCREAVTMLNEIVTSDGRKLIAATMSRVYELNQSAGNWRVLVDGLGNAGYTAEQCTCNSIRGVSSTMGSYLLFTNNIDPPMIYLLGTESFDCALNAMESISDLVALGITRAGGVIVWRGFAIWYDLNENGNRFTGDVMWSDLEDPNSYIESDTSFAGRATIAVGETILAAAPLGNWLILYTDKSIIRVTLVGGEDVFNFERIYTGGNALKYKFSLVNGGDFHLYLGESDIYVFTQFDTRPITVNWITRAAGFIFNGIVEDDATYDPLNKEMCNMVTGGWSEEKHEAFLSWPTGDNICPNVTLRLNMKFNAADLVDHGFTSFLTFRKDDRPTVGEWLEDMGICARGTKVAVGFKDGHVCSGDQDAVADPPLYLRNPTEDPDLPVHPDSLCAALGNRTLDDFCEDCAVEATFIAASADDFTLKQLEDDIYYRERLAAGALPCQGFNFSTESGESEGFSGTPIVLDQWLPIGGVNCNSISSVSLITKEINYENCGTAGTLAFSSAAETSKKLSWNPRWYEIEYADSIDRIIADSEDDTGISLIDFTGGVPVLDYTLPLTTPFRTAGYFYHPGQDIIVAFIRYGTSAPPFTYRLAFLHPVTGFISELDLGIVGGSNNHGAKFCPIDDTRIGLLVYAVTFTRPELIAVIDVSTQSVVVSQFYEGTGGVQPTRHFYGICYSCILDELCFSNNRFTGTPSQNFITRMNVSTLAITSEILASNVPADIVYINSTGKGFGWSNGYFDVDFVAGTSTLIESFGSLGDPRPKYHWKIDRVVAKDDTNGILLYNPHDFSKITIPLTNADDSYYPAVQRNGGKIYVHDLSGVSNFNIHEINVT